MPDRDESTAAAVAPPTVDPREWEDFAVFRETFLVQFTRPAHNAALRHFAEMLFDVTLEACRSPLFPELPGEPPRHDLAAAVADLRHLQGFLHMLFDLSEGGEGEERRLGRLAARAERALAKVADAIEGALG